MSQKNNPYCLKFTLALSCMLLCLFSQGQYNFQELDNLLSANQKVMGNDIVTLIYKDGKIVYQKEMGDFKIKSRVPVASCSKWLAAALIMTFIDEGKISLDDKVSSFLPIFETYGKSYITIRQCLSHQTGIAGAKMLERRKYESLEEEVNSFAKREIAANPGTVFFYSDMGLNIAGRVLEVISKKRFDLLAKQRIFTPLNMKNSSFTPEDNGVDPSGGAVCTAADYMNFLAMIADKGMFMGKRILSEAAITQMQTVQTRNITKKYTPKGTEGYEYGLGEWIEAPGNAGNSAIVSSPALYGAWPYIDKCRNYACIFFVKTLPGEPKKDFYPELKKAIDKQIPSTCN